MDFWFAAARSSAICAITWPGRPLLVVVVVVTEAPLPYALSSSSAGSTGSSAVLVFDSESTRALVSCSAPRRAALALAISLYCGETGSRKAS